MEEIESTRCPLTGDTATIGGTSDIMLVEQHQLGSYRLARIMHDVPDSASGRR